VVLHRARPAGEGEDLIVAEDPTPSLLRLHRDAPDLPASALLVDELELLGPHAPLQDRAEPLPQGRFVNQVLVRIHRALNDALPEPVGGVDQHRVPESALRVDGEHHSRAGQVRANHLLHAHREGDLQVVEPPLLPVDDRAVGEQRGEAPLDRVEQHRFAADVEVGLLLAGEARLREVLRGGAAADGDIAVRAELPLQDAVRGAHFGPAPPEGPHP
jgi:hypothetical protein